MCAVDEAENVKTAVSHCDRMLSEVTLMTLLLKCEAQVITVLGLKAKAVTAEENRKQSGVSVEERGGGGGLLELTHTEHNTNCTGEPCFTDMSIPLSVYLSIGSIKSIHPPGKFSCFFLFYNI